MSGRPKPHRLITDQSSEYFNKGQKKNKTLNRYSRDLILKLYNPINLYPGIMPDDALPLYLPIPDDPLLISPDFSISNVVAVNSRKILQKKPDAAFLESPQKQKSEKTPQNKGKGQGSYFGVHFDEHIKIKSIDEEEVKIKDEAQNEFNRAETVYMVPVYDKKLLQDFVSQGNPFAKAMIQTGINAEDDKLYFPLGLKPYERIWFYKDPNDQVQGPFSCIEMFNWTLRGCFPSDLPISFANTEFVPMNEYLSTKVENSGNIL